MTKLAEPKPTSLAQERDEAVALLVDAFNWLARTKTGRSKFYLDPETGKMEHVTHFQNRLQQWLTGRKVTRAEEASE